MKPHIPINSLKRFLTYGIFLAPLAHKVGGGRKDIIAVAAIRTSLASLLYALVLHAFPSDNLFNWLLTTSAAFVVTLLMEIHWPRNVLH